MIKKEKQLIVFGIVACGFGLWTQCGAVYDHINHYNSFEACKMHAQNVEDILPDWTHSKRLNVKVVCMDWKGEKRKIVPFLMMMEGQPKKVDA